MNSANRRIGVIGGSFDPIHIGHLMAAEGAREKFALERVLFVPAAAPPHKQDRALASPEDRFRMAELATADNPAFAVSDVEYLRPGPSYTVDTLRLLRETHPGSELFFIIGADTLGELPSWKDIGEVLQLCRIVTAARPGCVAESALASLRTVLGQEAFVAIRDGVFQVPLVGVSSTEIRARLRAGRDARYLAPDPVRAYIGEHGLYGARSGNDL